MKTPRLFVHLAILLHLLCLPLLGTDIDTAKLAEADRLIEKAIADKEIPGAVLLVGKGDQIVHRKAYGYRVLADQTPMQVDAIFDLASLTKPIATGTSIMKLIEAGRINPSDPVAKHIPEFGANGKDKITIEQLLLHTGGLIPDNHLRDYQDGVDLAWQRIWDLKPVCEPGTEFKYTDVGYLVLGKLVERISGKPLDRFVQEEIFGPLKMRDTAYTPPTQWHDRIVPTTFHGQVHDPRAQALGGVAGHAGLFATADDLSRYCRMILRGGELDGVRILRPETVAMMTRMRTMDDGGNGRTFGFDADSSYSSVRGSRFAEGTTFGHTGFTGTMLWIDPVHDMYAILLTSRLQLPDGGKTQDLRRGVMTAVAEAVLGASKGATPSEPVLSGLDVLVRDKFEPLAGRKVGLITNHTGRDARGRRNLDLLHEADNVELVAIFSPEHGLFGKLDEKVGHGVDEATGLKVWSLYGETRRPTEQMLEGIDTIVFDIQDIGTRFYTYNSTMLAAMEEAAKHKLRFVVLDRPNPINATRVAGPLADEDKLSFVACKPIPLVHGMTTGELARMFNAEYKIGADLLVIPAENYRRDMWWDETYLRWINPSPNMRSLKEAILYPAVGVIEFTNVSVGRGTDAPFERIGAPWIDGDQLATALNEALSRDGLKFYPIRFTPESSKYSGEECGGVHIEIIDRDAIEPARAGLTIAYHLKRLYGDKWKHEPMLKLLANDKAHAAWQTIADPAKLPDTWADDLNRFKQTREKYLLYK